MPQQVPDWRPGVVYWKPTADGKEIGVYPQITGNALLYRGPLADDFGYDEAWEYAEESEAVVACAEWDGESEFPPGRWQIRPKGGHSGDGKKRPKQPEVGETVPYTIIDEWRNAGDRVNFETIQTVGSMSERYLIDRKTRDGKGEMVIISYTGVEKDALAEGGIEIVIESMRVQKV